MRADELAPRHQLDVRCAARHVVEDPVERGDALGVVALGEIGRVVAAPVARNFEEICRAAVAREHAQRVPQRVADER